MNIARRTQYMKILFVLTLFLVMGCFLLSAANGYLNELIFGEAQAVEPVDPNWAANSAKPEDWPLPALNYILPPGPEQHGFDESKPKRAYLTFDDGPSENTATILGILNRYGVKATFFVIGRPNLKDKYQLIIDQGSTLALHSYCHEYSDIYKSQSAYFSDLNKLRSLIKDTTGYAPNIIRFPGGSSNTRANKYSKGLMKELVVEVENRGYVYYDWNVDSGDATGNNVKKETLVNNVKNGIGERKVINILMHDTGSYKLTTVEALPEIIEYLLNAGFEICPITENTTPVHHRI